MLRIAIIVVPLPSSDGSCGWIIVAADVVIVASVIVFVFAPSPRGRGHPLASRVCVGVRLARLTLDGGSVFQRLQDTTWAGNDFRAGRKTRCNLDVGFAGDAGGDFDKLHL